MAWGTLPVHRLHRAQPRAWAGHGPPVGRQIAPEGLSRAARSGMSAPWQNPKPSPVRPAAPSFSKWSGRCEGLRRMEHHRRGGAAVDRPGLEIAGRQARQRRSRSPIWPPKKPRRRAPSRHGRTRPRAGRRSGAGLGDSGRRRSRHRQIDAAAAGRRKIRPQAGLKTHLCLRRGGQRPGAHARPASGPGRRAGAAGRRNQPARHPDHAGGRAPRPGDHRFDPDHVGRQRRKRAGLVSARSAPPRTS